MAAFAFDTLKFVETLKGTGVPENQAKAISMVVQTSFKNSDLATKQDLRYEISNLRKDMNALHADTQHQIKELGLQLTIRLGTIVVAVVGILPLISKLLNLS